MSRPEPTEGEKDMVAAAMFTCIKAIHPLIEGDFLEEFMVDFSVDGQDYTLELKRKKP